MANTEWWQRGPIDGIPAVLQPIAHVLLQVRESVGEIVEPLTEQEWNARPAGVASAAFHVRHIAGVIDRLFTYARGNALSTEQVAAIQSEGQELLAADVATVLGTLGKVGRRGLPKNPLQFAATLRTLVKHEGFDASVAIPFQRFLSATLGRVSEALGYRAVYPRFVGDSRP
jgi:hypothetical protein